MARHLVMVYGTLMTGYNNNWLLEGSDYITKAETVEKYKLTASGIPFVSRSEKISRIQGELYFVEDETLARLDQLEGHPAWYKREKIIVRWVGYSSVAWLYFNEYEEGSYTIKNGDYRTYARNVVV